MPKVSIIVPIYNAGIYLKKCLDSLVSQTLKDIEIICVLDCPTDGSDVIAKQYAERDSRIIIVENETNLHIGESRNVGINIATGEYIAFVDDDDYCEQNMYELLYGVANKKLAPIGQCCRDCVYVDKNTVVTFKEYFGKENNTCESLLKQVLSGELSSNAFGLWNKIYSRDFIIEHELKFLNTKYNSGEDAIFNFTVYSLLIKNDLEIIHIPDVLYHHIFHTHNTGKSDLYQSNQIKFRETLSSIMKNSISYNDYCQNLYIGNVRYLYMMYRHHYFKFSSLLIYPNICANIKECYSIWKKELTLPKNIFSQVLRFFLIKNGN